MKSWFKITASATGTASIDIFDEIGFWGITAKDFVAQLRALTGVQALTLNIDSPGGSVEDGFTIYDAIMDLGIPVTANITGTAASMASVIMLAASKIKIAEHGRVMIHRVTGGAAGNADDMAAAAAVIKQFEDRIVAVYVERTGKDEAEIRDLMKAEMGTWFFGQEAIDAGFADELIKGTRATAFKPQWAKNFTMLPAALFDTRSETKPTAPPLPKNMKAILALASLVGVALKGDETEDQIVTACQAHKPAPQKLELNLEDAETKAHFDGLVSNATKPLQAKIEALEALIKNGAAGSAGAGSPVPGAGGQAKSKDEQITDLQAELSACKDSRERGKIINAIAKLRSA